jgi:hypothetical protein
MIKNYLKKKHNQSGYAFVLTAILTSLFYSGDQLFGLNGFVIKSSAPKSKAFWTVSSKPSADSIIIGISRFDSILTLFMISKPDTNGMLISVIMISGFSEIIFSRASSHWNKQLLQTLSD